MPTSSLHGRALARAVLVAVVLAAAPSDVRTQDRMSAQARDWARQSVQALRVREEQRVQLNRERAHAQMPSTMYASTPDPGPPHPLPLASSTAEHPPAPAPPASPAGTPVARAYRVALFPAAGRWAEGGYQGVVRIINHGDVAGEVRIDAVDDAGTRHGPLTLVVDPGESVQLTSADLEHGNAASGLDGATGAGEGDWRLGLTSGLDFEVLAYIRTGDGFLTALHDRAPVGAGGYQVPFFIPGSNVTQVSRLRLVNPGAEVAQVHIEAIDDTGAPAPGTVRLELPPGAARTLSAHELESGAPGLAGALGSGQGRWRLLITSPQPLEVMSLVSSPTGHLTNVSTSPATATLDGDAFVHEVPFLPTAARRLRDGIQGFVRVINHAGQAGTVRIEAFDDEGTAFTPLTLAIGANQAVHLSAEDLEHGNLDMGLSGGIGTGTGDWRLRLRSTLELEVLAYVQSDDGFLASVHDRVALSRAGHHVAMFHPGSGSDLVSRLRLVNPGDRPAQVRIEGIDDHGESAVGAVRLEVPARGARSVTAHQLESGEGVDGALGDGAGRWRLSITADQPIEVMSLLSSPAGHLANLSTSTPDESAESVFRELVSGPVVQAKCALCHVPGGIAGATRLLFARPSSPSYQSHNLAVFRDFLDTVDDGAEYILNKIQGVAHGGGPQVAAGTDGFAHMERFLALLGEEVAPTPSITPETLFDTVRMASARKTLRRAALIFVGRIPTDAEYAAAERGPTALRATIRGLMTGPEFHEFLIRGANDRLLTDRNDGEVIHHRGFVEFKREEYRRAKAAYESGNEHERWEWLNTVGYGTRRAPLELIAHVVENDRPYTEILTADYIMANPWAAAAYGAPTHHFNDPTDFAEFKPSRIESYYREGGDGFEVEYDPVLDMDWIVDPGPLHTDYPHAGILNTTVFLQRYPSTATNRNRARSRWTYYHFLGLDIEKSAPRTTDPEALADTNNPTMSNPACTVCHRVLDPVAGAFQNYGDEGFYRDQWEGLDSLDGHYKDGWANVRETFEITAESRAEPQTVSVRARLPAGAEMVRIDPYFEPPRPDGSEIWWNMGIEHVAVRDGYGVEVSRLELETVAAELELCGSHEPRYDHTSTRDTFYEAWFCIQRVPVQIPEDGVYDIELVVWVQYQHDGVANQRRMLDLSAGGYQEGDTWYRDMRAPGFDDQTAPHAGNSVQWLAQQIVVDERFAEATVKFWWPALMGSEVAEPPEEAGDADFEGRLLLANAQGAEVERLARGFRYGFLGGRAYNLKDLLIEMVLSKWFRADAVEDADPVRQVALRGAGARRLLTPEELARKTAAVTGVQWGRRISENVYDGEWPNELTGEFRLLYGGIDSAGIPERSRDMTTVMASVAKTHATRLSCPVVMRELYLLPDAERRLFSGIDTNVTPISELGASFDIESRSRAEKETLSLNGALSAGSATVRLAYANDYWGGSSGTDRNLYLDRLELRDAAGRVVDRQELEGLGPAGDCNRPDGDVYALRCEGSVEAAVDVPASGIHTLAIVASAEQAGDERPRLTVTVESDVEDSAGANAIRAKLVELHETLLGVKVTPHSPDVEAAYRLFVDVWERKRASEETETWFRGLRCDWASDIHLWDGILDDAVVEHEDEHGRRYDWDNDLIDAYMDGIDWSDDQYTAQTWLVVLAYLMTDYRYLYL